MIDGLEGDRHERTVSHHADGRGTRPALELRPDRQGSVPSSETRSDPARVRGWVHRRIDELLDGRVDDAEALCRDFIQDFPGEAEGFALLSMIFEERGQRERALELLRQASDTRPYES